MDEPDKPDLQVAWTPSRPTLFSRSANLWDSVTQSLATISKVAAVFGIIGLLSTFLYGSFYYAYVPVGRLSAPLHFERVAVLQEEKVVHSEVHKTFVEGLSARVTVGPTGLSELYGGQEYAVEVHADMPESDVNVAAGAFGIVLKTYDCHGNALRRSRRMAMLQYRSWTLRLMDTFFFSPLYLFGLMAQHQDRVIEMDSHYVEDIFKPTCSVTVSLESPMLQVYSASVHMRAKLAGLKYWMFHWPITTGFVCFLMLQVFLSFVVFMPWVGFAIGGSSQTSTVSPVINGGDNLPPTAKDGQGQDNNEVETIPEVQAPNGSNGEDQPPDDGPSANVLKQRRGLQKAES